MITARGTWVEDLETRMDDQAAEADKERRIEELERRVADLEEWLGSVAEDMLDRTPGPIGRRLDERSA